MPWPVRPTWSSGRSMVRDFRLRRLPASFRYAARGLWHVLRTEQNMRIHLVMTLIALGLASYLEIPLSLLAILTLTIGFVLASEVLNSVIEDFLDIVHPDHHDKVRRIKDVLAGSVLLSALVALIVGGLIFVPRIIARIS